MSEEPYRLTIQQSRALLRSRQASSVELTRAVLDRISLVETRVKSFVTVTPEVALLQAEQADRRLAQGDEAPLLGIPAAIKDVISTKGVRTTCSSRMLENFIPTYDAAVMERLQSQGLVMVGKTNMDEFAMGSSTENSAFFPTHNPWDLSRVPGGSSGGSAACVAAGEAIYSLGSDTGGSIRQPASFCNLVGMKPTYGRVSRFGLVAFASSLDQIGPFTRDVADCAVVLGAISGYDPRDSTSANVPVPDYTRALLPDLKGVRIGVPKEYFVEGMQPEVEARIKDAIARLRDLGASVDWEVSLPHTPYALAVYYIIAPSEASANLSRYDGVKYGFSAPASNVWEAISRTRQEGFGPEVKRRIMLGAYALSSGYYDAYYVKAQKVRTLIKADFDRAFERYDVLVTPTSPTVPFKIGEKSEDPMQMYLSDIFTIPMNIAGICGLSLPAGLVDGLPVGLQIMGPAFGEEAVLRAGYAYQQATDWHKRRPPL
ncbi:MAG: Asp-tRNA(Asn)/Glu-tRNA(Gln) amidotransferase subunit GatA [Dehalococcoidia bacterium]|nr:Asp-tRNA(Asn)/Glu-tRNA(Gln) amidotransferase subunit GatA [Dehalococcoidia bacterium]